MGDKRISMPPFVSLARVLYLSNSLFLFFFTQRHPKLKLCARYVIAAKSYRQIGDFRQFFLLDIEISFLYYAPIECNRSSLESDKIANIPFGPTHQAAGISSVMTRVWKFFLFTPFKFIFDSIQTAYSSLFVRFPLVRYITNGHGQQWRLPFSRSNPSIFTLPPRLVINHNHAQYLRYLY